MTGKNRRQYKILALRICILCFALLLKS